VFYDSTLKKKNVIYILEKYRKSQKHDLGIHCNILSCGK